MTEKNHPLKVLIFYTKVGGGHESIAQSLKEHLEEYFERKVEVVMIDPIGSIMESTYYLSTVASSKIYSLFFKISQKSLPMTILKKINEFMNIDKLRNLVEEHDPDLVISTHFSFAQEVKMATKNFNKNIPVVLYIADPFTMHPVWFKNNVDLYLSYDIEHIKTLNLPPHFFERLIPIGMPIRRAFYEKYNKDKTLSMEGLDPYKTTIFFGGSGSGMDRIERLVQPFLDSFHDCQALFFCGRNELLEKALKILIKKHPNVRVYGYTPSESLAAFMQASDLFVGKVGPNIMFESVLSGLPLIATPPVLDQEKGNRDFIEREGLGFLTNNTEQTLAILEKVLKSPDLLAKSKENMQRARNMLLSIEEEGYPRFFAWIEKTFEM